MGDIITIAGCTVSTENNGDFKISNMMGNVITLKNKNTIECSAKPIIKYIPIKGIDNSALMYAVLINQKKKKYQLISDKNNNIKCIFN